MKIEIATAAELRAARVAHGEEAQHHVGEAHDPQRQADVSERLLSEAVMSERSGVTTLSPSCRWRRASARSGSSPCA